MIHVPPTTESLVIDVPVGAGRSYYAAKIAAMLRGERSRKPPKPSIRTLVKRAEAATGKTVTAITTLADGATKLDLGTGEQQQGNEVDEWIAKHADKTQRH